MRTWAIKNRNLVLRGRAARSCRVIAARVCQEAKKMEQLYCRLYRCSNEPELSCSTIDHGFYRVFGDGRCVWRRKLAVLLPCYIAQGLHRSGVIGHNKTVW